MKKNKFLKLASGLLVLCLLTTCVISTTFAKYVTEDSANDTARVAKWGVTVSVQAGDSGSAFYNTYEKDYGGTITNTVEALDKVVAPGTDGTLAQFEVNGTPEVAVDLAFDITDSTGTGNAKDVFVNTYNPIRFNVYKDGAATPMTGGEGLTLSELVAFVEAFSGEYEPNVTLDATYKITWAWVYDGAHDVEDTLLGNLAADKATYGAGMTEGTDYNLTIDFALTITATQID